MIKPLSTNDERKEEAIDTSKSITLSPPEKQELLRLYDEAVTQVSRMPILDPTVSRVLLESLQLLYVAFADEPNELRGIGTEFMHFGPKILKAVPDFDNRIVRLDKSIVFTTEARSRLFCLLNELATACSETRSDIRN